MEPRCPYYSPRPPNFYGERRFLEEEQLVHYNDEQLSMSMYNVCLINIYVIFSRTNMLTFIPRNYFCFDSLLIFRWIYTSWLLFGLMTHVSVKPSISGRYVLNSFTNKKIDETLSLGSLYYHCETTQLVYATWNCRIMGSLRFHFIVH